MDHNTEKHSPLFQKVTQLRQLKKAWRKIHKNGLQSKSQETKDEITSFEQDDIDKKLKRMERQLRDGSFIFSGSKGIAIKKKDSKSRPLVIAPIPVRIVQRSILDILQARKKIEKKYLSVKSSFGALMGKGVPDAAKKICQLIEDGKTYYIRSDIRNFFTKIDLDSVIDTIGLDLSAESDFINLLKSVTKLELNNIQKLRKNHGDLFNLDESGVPQGCCLSPLIANIFLYDFDCKMNNSDFSCIRYLDDFIILGKDQITTEAAFKKAKKILTSLRLEIHNPEEAGSKAGKGHTKSKFNFLGLEFNLKRKIISPSSENQSSLKSDIRELLEQSLKEMKKPDDLDSKHSMTNTLMLISNKVKGWGNTFLKACEGYIDRALMGSIDKEINEIVFNYIYTVNKLIEKNNATSPNKRKIVGIHSISDSLQD